MQKICMTVVVFLLAGSVSAGEVAVLTVVALSNGLNHVDLTGDGVQDLVILAHRENFNAHSFEVASFYVFVDGQEGAQPALHIVPFQNTGKESFEMFVSGGADCILHDFRLVYGAQQVSASLIMADRDFGNGFWDSQPVTFTYYELKRNVENEIGAGLYSFELSRIVRSTSEYCDVGEAFEQELDLSDYRYRGDE